jgi:CIC family chloride channel protein
MGLICGLAAVCFTKVVYKTEDISQRWLPSWWTRALVLGTIVGVTGVVYPRTPPALSQAAQHELATGKHRQPPLFGVGYEVVDHALHLEIADRPTQISPSLAGTDADKTVRLQRHELLKELWWLLPLALLKPLMTSLTLGGGGSGGIFAPSLFLGATLGASFGLICNFFLPGISANPGVYAIVGMGAVVAGTTHGVLSAILVVYEMTSDYHIILPIMIAAGLASIVARVIDPESIYHKKITRRGESIARVHEMHRLEHIMVRDVMIRQFPSVKQRDDVTEIVRVARANPTIESLPVMSDDGNLVGIIRPEDLHRVLDSNLPPQLVQAHDIALQAPIAVSPDENLLEALRDFGTRDIETLPVEVGSGHSRRLVGLLLRADVMRRYREEMLELH